MAKKKENETTPIPAAETQPMQKKTRPIFKADAEKPAPEPQPETVAEPAQAESPAPKKKRGLWVLIGILGMLLIGAAGAGVGYKMAIDLRQREELNQRLVMATTQFEQALQDEKNGNLDLARQRLEYILTIYPEYPGLDGELSKVMLNIALTQGPSQITTPSPSETPVAASTPIPTQDTKNLGTLLNQAQAQLAGQDWNGLLATVLNMRNLDPFYQAVKVDGLYYMALRNMGIEKVKQGSLEPGIFYFALAEQMAPIDNDAESYRIWARMYSNAGSYWEVNMEQAAYLFSQLYPLVPNLVDASGITVRSRYADALAGYGDYLQQTYLWCDAVPQYQNSLSIKPSDAVNAKFVQAQEYCVNPPSTPTPTVDPNVPTPTTPPG